MNGKKGISDLLITLAPFAILGIAGVALYKKFFGDPNADTVKLTVKTVKDEANTRQSQGERPSYSDSQYVTFADTLAAAMEGMGTDEATIYNVMNQMKSLLDVLKLIAAFGVRTYHEFFTVEEQYNLAQWFQNELSTSEIAKLNKILSDKNINFKF